MHRPLLNDQKLSDQKALRGYSAYQLRRSSQVAVRMLLHSIMRRELWAHYGPVMGKGAAYWRTARLRGLHIYQRSFASSPNFLPVAPIYESRRLPKWNETMKQVRRFNIALGDNLTGCFGGSPADPAECQR